MQNTKDAYFLKAEIPLNLLGLSFGRKFNFRSGKIQMKYPGRRILKN